MLISQLCLARRHKLPVLHFYRAPITTKAACSHQVEHIVTVHLLTTLSNFQRHQSQITLPQILKRQPAIIAIHKTRQIVLKLRHIQHIKDALRDKFVHSFAMREPLCFATIVYRLTCSAQRIFETFVNGIKHLHALRIIAFDECVVIYLLVIRQIDDRVQSLSVAEYPRKVDALLDLRPCIAIASCSFAWIVFIILDFIMIVLQNVRNDSIVRKPSIVWLEQHRFASLKVGVKQK
mmetsp:Transcript_19764/g.31451  ORF Transcript_19764/g.31451 Transcript_19764/m.31451 type:complete len:235 (+) Transcript_19764:217-921(+)